VLGDHGDGFFGVVGPLDEVHVYSVDGAAFDQGVVYEGSHVFPELFAHDDDRELFDFFGLDEDEGFEDFVHGSESAWHDDEGFGVFDEHDFAYKEVVEVYESVEVWVGDLFHWEFDVAAERQAAFIAGSSVGCFHDSWSAAGHDGVAMAC